MHEPYHQSYTNKCRQVRGKPTTPQVSANMMHTKQIKKTRSTRLEGLPSRVRTSILMNMPDLSSLRALLHAIPEMNTHYARREKNILRACLHRELDGVFPDAYATMMSQMSVLGSPRTNEKIIKFVDSYNKWLSGSTIQPNIRLLCRAQLRWLAAFHVSVARPVADCYHSWMDSNLTTANASSDSELVAVCEDGREIKSPWHREVNRNEDMQVLRAIYRYETFYHLFGHTYGVRRGGFSRDEIDMLFFELFAASEVNSIGSLDLFSWQKYDSVSDGAKEYLHYHSGVFGQPWKRPNPFKAFDLMAEYEDYMEGTVPGGLELVARVIALTRSKKPDIHTARRPTHEPCFEASSTQGFEHKAQDGILAVEGDFANARVDSVRIRAMLHFVREIDPRMGCA